MEVAPVSQSPNDIIPTLSHVNFDDSDGDLWNEPEDLQGMQRPPFPEPPPQLPSTSKRRRCRKIVAVNTAYTERALIGCFSTCLRWLSRVLNLWFYFCLGIEQPMNASHLSTSAKYIRRGWLDNVGHKRGSRPSATTTMSTFQQNTASLGELSISSQLQRTTQMPPQRIARSTSMAFSILLSQSV